MQKSVKTRSARKERDFSIAIITLLFMAVLALIHPQYRSINNYMNILREASFVGIAALGMLNVIITNNTDLSIGTMMALAAVIMLKLMPTVGVPAGILICILICVSLSLLNGYLVVYCRISAFILTLGMQYAFKGIAFIITHQKIIAAKDPLFTQIGNMNLFATKGFDGIPLPFVIFLVSTIISYILLHRTGFGRKLFAISSSENAAYLAGINVKPVKLLTYGILGIFVHYDLLPPLDGKRRNARGLRIRRDHHRGHGRRGAHLRQGKRYQHVHILHLLCDDLQCD